VKARLLVPVLVALPLVAAACGGGGSNPFKAPGPPVGHALLPDIAPSPPLDVHIKKAGGRWVLSFSSILVNIGDGDFLLRATRTNGVWHVEQDVPYSTSGAKTIVVPAKLVWAGDGHNHWHIARIATNRLVRIGADGKASLEGGVVDSKTGFCFYDVTRVLDKGPLKAVYPRGNCGKSQQDDNVAMGLSLGWADIYNYSLPGQSIDVTKLPDGLYRLWAKADERHWFREQRHDNNTTWVDLRLSTRPNHARAVRVVRNGPPIRG
jgi:lysyl oxidase